MSIPKGYKLVPVEPTYEILTALIDTWFAASPIDDQEAMAQAYNAMLASAPAQPQPIYDEAKERQLFEDSMIEASEEAGFGEPDLYRDSAGCYRQEYHQAAWGGWLACAQARAKAGEVGHE